MFCSSFNLKSVRGADVPSLANLAMLLKKSSRLRVSRVGLIWEFSVPLLKMLLFLVVGRMYRVIEHFWRTLDDFNPSTTILQVLSCLNWFCEASIHVILFGLWLNRTKFCLILRQNRLGVQDKTKRFYKKIYISYLHTFSAKHFFFRCK